MLAYLARRLLLMIPTLFGVMLVSFAIVQFVPGGPVERAIAQLQNADQSGIGGAGAGAADIASRYRGSQGLDPKFIKELQKQYGFDKPAWERFLILVRDYSTFNLGRSYYRDVPVIELIREKLPVSMSLGLWMTLISYAISIPLGVSKAVRDGSRFDIWSSAVVIVGYAIPSFLFAILLLTLFGGGSFWALFPLRGLTSDNFAQFDWPHKILDYLWHIALPVASLVIGSFATSTLLTKNSFLDEIRKAYVQTARMKGLTERQVLYGHVFRNAMLIVIAGFPGAFVGAFFAGSLLIEQVFTLDGLGYLSYESLINRDYPVVLGTLYIYALIGLIVNLISDITYTLIDPRIDFETREV
ncbi:MAG TPA: microcin C ABC transporter permease YejB [Roseiarcus sp.]|nr:microcin C ABC transporter permease YejB [Roseiarcus sp.]